MPIHFKMISMAVFFFFWVTRSCVCVSVQPSLLALALLCFEAHEQHDPEHLNKISEALSNLQQQLNVSPCSEPLR